ncbi:Maf-like protein [Hyphomicrobiales bacterium 4NK60-0047b]|jgi:septum formation protein
MFEQKTKIILASNSKIRAELLENTGLSFEIQPANVDEAAIREIFKTEEMDPADVAEVLAETKATEISKQNPDALIIGCDQILALGDEIFEKPKNRDDAQSTLFKLRGKTHTLISAVVLVKNNEVIWRYSENANLKMHEFSPEFLGQYMALCGDKILSSVGAYQLESFGIHLFEEIKGDYFTVLGFPILALLKFLRSKGYTKS